MPVPPTFDVRLSRERMLSPAVRELELERVDGQTFAFEAGQWVSLILPLAEGEARRAYSIASAPNDTPRFEVAVTKVEGGAGSGHLHALPIGATLRVIGPQGFFTRGGDHPSLFVGTGTGATPLRSMIHRALAQGHIAPMHLLVGARFEVDRLYREELEALAELHSNFRFSYTLSQGATRLARAPRLLPGARRVALEHAHPRRPPSRLHLRPRTHGRNRAGSAPETNGRRPQASAQRTLRLIRPDGGMAECAGAYDSG